MSVRTCSACFTSFANPRHPLDAYSVADLDCCIVGSRAHLDNLAYTFVAANLARLCGERQDGPRVHHHAQIRVTNTRVRPSNSQLVKIQLLQNKLTD
jgi:hypothetical protein